MRSRDVTSGRGLYTKNRVCLRCGYDLRAHPISARCPECGLFFDVETAIWHPPKWYSLGHRVLPVLVLGHLLMAGVVQSSPVMGVLVEIVCLCVVFMMARDALAHRERWFVAITPEGLVLNSPKFLVGRSEVPWDRAIKAMGGTQPSPERISTFLAIRGIYLGDDDRGGFNNVVAARIHDLMTGAMKDPHGSRSSNE